MIYYLLFLLLLFFGVFDFVAISRINKVIIVSGIGVFLVLLGGLRWETGTDWDSYYDFFRKNNTYSDFTGTSFEYIYSVLSYFIKSIANSYTLFLLTFCFLTISIKLYGFFKISDGKYIFLIFLLYYASQLADISPTRQSLALSVSLVALLFLIEFRLIPFLLFSITAFYIHSSAIVLLFAIPFFYFKLDRKKIIWVLCLSFVAGFFIIAAGANNFIFSLVLGGESNVADKLQEYKDIQEIGNSSTGSAIDPKVSYILGSIRRTFVLIPSLFFYKKLVRNEKFLILLNLYMIGSVIYLVFSPIIQVLNRLSAYYDLSEFFIIPMFVNLPQRKYWKLLIYVIVALYAFAKFNSTLISFWNYYNPYKLCF